MDKKTITKIKSFDADKIFITVRASAWGLIPIELVGYDFKIVEDNRQKKNFEINIRF